MFHLWKSEPSYTEVSKSKLQIVIWTVVTICAYAGVFAARIIDPAVSADKLSLPNIPLNLLLLMGFSAVTAAGAKGIALSRVERELQSKEDELLKTQMIVWTFVAATVYVFTVINFVTDGAYRNADISLPDIDGSLLVLMGVSQGAYLGNKLISQQDQRPRILTVSPSRPVIGQMTYISGENFGDLTTNSRLLLKGKSKEFNLVLGAPEMISWQDTEIRFQMVAEMGFIAGDELEIFVKADSGLDSAVIRVFVT